MKAAETAMSTAVSFGGTLSKHFASQSLSNLVSGPLLYLPLWCRGDFFCTTTPASFSNQRFRQRSTRWCHFHRYRNAHLLKSATLISLWGQTENNVLLHLSPELHLLANLVEYMLEEGKLFNRKHLTLCALSLYSVL